MSMSHNTKSDVRNKNPIPLHEMLLSLDDIINMYSIKTEDNPTVCSKLDSSIVNIQSRPSDTLKESNNVQNIEFVDEKAITYNLFEILVTELEKLDEQGGEKWRSERIKIIGGSEMSKFLYKKSKYGDKYSLFNEKIHTNLNKEDLDIVKSSGNFFEDITFIFLKEVLNIAVRKVGGPYISKKTNSVGYSGDALAPMTMESIKALKNIYGINLTMSIKATRKQNLIVLFEMKSPFRRIPISGKISDDYISQVQTGLYLLPNVDLLMSCIDFVV